MGVEVVRHAVPASADSAPSCSALPQGGRLATAAVPCPLTELSGSVWSRVLRRSASTTAISSVLGLVASSIQDVTRWCA
ncbi:hypothetical protein AB0D86_18000 [Streptomyces sp. NPDC048324]|uniref:hypothetical protein n=1 Tax=Streptomyces sp. NPDC048324 TaxID=3157205 RepID=UPI00341D88C2